MKKIVSFIFMTTQEFYNLIDQPEPERGITIKTDRNGEGNETIEK